MGGAGLGSTFSATCTRFSLAEPPASASRSWALTARERYLQSVGPRGARVGGWDGHSDGQSEGRAETFWSGLNKGPEGSEQAPSFFENKWGNQLS